MVPAAGNLPFQIRAAQVPAARACYLRALRSPSGPRSCSGRVLPPSSFSLAKTQPMLLAGLLYLGSGTGLSLFRWTRSGKTAEAPLRRPDMPWLAGAVLFGGVLGPVLLMFGLRVTPAATASLLLNFEGALTALLAWFVFHENFDRPIALTSACVASEARTLGRVDA